MFWLNGEFSLGLSNSVKSHNKPPKPSDTRDRRGKGINSNGRRMVRSALYLMQLMWGKWNLAFLTCTVPSLDYRKMKLLASRWGEVVRRYQQELKRELERSEIDTDIVLVTEIQEKRYRETGEVAPHLHIVFRGRKSRGDDWAVSKERARVLWENVLSAVLKRKIEAPASTRIESIRKNVENYLSKYMSKGGEIIKEIVNNGEKNELPAAWWGMTNTLRKRVKAGCKPISEDIKKIIYDQREELKSSGIIKWFHVVTVDLVETSGEILTIPVALVGKLSRPEYADMFGRNKWLHFGNNQ